MSEPLPPGAERRRSPRTTLELPVHIRGRSPRGSPLSTTARTLNASHHGARLECGAEFARGTEVVLRNPNNEESVTYRVVWVLARPGQQWEMGVELVSGEPFLLGGGPAESAGAG